MDITCNVTVSSCCESVMCRCRSAVHMLLLWRWNEWYFRGEMAAGVS